MHLDVTILVVDDDPESLRATQRLLSHHGLKVVTSQTSIGVSALVKKHNPALVVLDVDMPALSGRQLAGMITNQASALISIVFYSGLEESELYDLFRLIPGSTYVQKAAGPHALWTAVLRALRIGSTHSSGEYSIRVPARA